MIKNVTFILTKSGKKERITDRTKQMMRSAKELQKIYQKKQLYFSH